MDYGVVIKRLETSNRVVRMQGRKWEELDVDCLVNIFTKVGLESLVDGVPFVCKSWYEATLTKSQRKKYKQRSIVAFAKLVVRRSQGSAKAVYISSAFCMSQVTKLIGDGCPSLKKLLLQCGGHDVDGKLTSLIWKWKNLEVLKIYGGVYTLVKIIRQISIHCKNFVSLSVIGADIDQIEASTIATLATLLPNLEYLSFMNSWIFREELIIILKGCKRLKYFDAGDWFKYDEDDEIKNHAAYITTFKFDASFDEGCCARTRAEIQEGLERGDIFINY